MHFSVAKWNVEVGNVAGGEPSCPYCQLLSFMPQYGWRAALAVPSAAISVISSYLSLSSTETLGPFQGQVESPAS